MRTKAKTFQELEKDIKSKIKLEENVEIVLEYEENGQTYVFSDMKDLEDGMTIKVSISSQSDSSRIFLFFSLSLSLSFFFFFFFSLSLSFFFFFQSFSNQKKKNFFKKDNSTETSELSNWNQIILFHQFTKKSEFRVEIEPDEIPPQFLEQIKELMKSFSELQTCARFQKTPSGIVFQVDFISKNRAEKAYNQLITLLQSS